MDELPESTIHAIDTPQEAVLSNSDNVTEVTDQDPFCNLLLDLDESQLHHIQSTDRQKKQERNKTRHLKKETTRKKKPRPNYFVGIPITSTKVLRTTS